jgi:peptidoglycan/LPS O-acetylase OafA/YrhL
MRLFKSEASTRAHGSAYRPDIDGLRAIAVLSVVGFHAFPNWIRGGFVGVDVFFVISGFLISNIILGELAEDRFSFRRFYARRVKRIFPALLLVLTGCLVLGWFSLLADEYRQLGKHVAGGAGFVANLVLVRESGYFDNEAETKPLLHLWSLGIEEQFYIVWPLLLFCLRHYPRTRLSVLLLLLGSTLTYSVLRTPVDSVTAFYSPFTRFWELTLGSLLAGQYVSARQELAWARLRDGLTVLGLGSIVWACTSFTRETPFPGWHALIPTLGACLLIGAGPDTWLSRRILSQGLTVWFGLVSYPLYLWHWPLLSFEHIASSGSVSATTRLAAVTVSIVLAWLTYRFLECPIRFDKRGTLTPLFLCGLMLIVGTSGYGIFLRAGFPQRTANNLSTLLEPSRLAAAFEARQTAIRAPVCHLNKPEQSFADFQSGLEDCLRISTDRKNLLIIGDSTAADLYVALAHGFPEFNILQATGASCSPVALTAQANCHAVVEYALASAEHHKLDAVLLAARWKGENLAQEHMERLAEICRRLKASGNKTILVGPPPEYSAEIKAILGRMRYAQDPDTYVRPYFVDDKLAYQQTLQTFARNAGILFLDRLHIYCGADLRCPVTDGKNALFISDRHHLSVPGALYLAQRLRDSGVLMQLLDSDEH